MNPKEIIEFIRAGSAHPMKPRELAKALKIPESEYPGFRKMLSRLIESGELIKLKRGRIGLANQMNMLVGNITINRKGMGFLPREGEDQDLVVPQPDLLTALDGDKVMVRLTGTRSGRASAAVIKVVERTPRNIVGIFHIGKAFSFVVPDNPRIHRHLYINPEKTLGASDGEKVVAVLTAWDHPYLNPEGEVTEILGVPGQPGVDMAAVVKSFNLPEEFPPEVLDEAERAAAGDFEEDHVKRVDMSGECIYTIDPYDAKDFDDAVSVVKTDRGYRLGVHIADVSHYVKEGTHLDREALRRGNSVYLPGMVVPMLPEVLSNDVCSLRPNRRRMAHSAIIDFDKSGNFLKGKIQDSVIKSSARLAYEEVQEYFDNPSVIKGKTSLARKLGRVADNLDTARKLAQILSKKRFAEGSLDFDLPEAKIVLDKDGAVIEVKERVRLEAHRLVEEFMLIANRVVALEVFRKAKPFLYRVHAKPDMEKAGAFSDMMNRLGYKFPVSPTMKPIQYARFIESVKGAPESEFINELMLRSMQKAVYQRENIGHFGLAFKHYTHFTSPIRRYPDLLVHRMLRRLTQKKFTASYTKQIVSTIDNVGRHCSETERHAEAAEREAVKIKQVAYMAKHVGEEYTGVISGVMPFGFFVRLDGVGVEGLVRMSSIDDDYYVHDEKQYRITGRRGGRTFRLGDPVKVGVMKVDKAASEVDLFLSDEPEKKTRPRKEPKPDNRKTRRKKQKKMRRSQKRSASNAGNRKTSPTKKTGRKTRR